MATVDLITELNTDLKAAYDAVAAKGGTVPENKNSNNLATAIGSITAAGRPPLPEYPYPIDEAQMDGGEFGTVAYLRDDMVHYYTATSASDIKYSTGSSTSSITVYNLKTLEDGFIISNQNLLGVAFGTTQDLSISYLVADCPLLQVIYFS